MAKKTKLLDHLWSKAVKKRAGNQCEVCGSQGTLHAHHIFSRRFYSLRWDLENGVCLCFKHHFGYAHQDPINFYEWVKQRRDLDYLKSKKNKTGKTDYTAIELYLKNELNKR